MTEAEMQMKRYQALMKNALDGVHIMDIRGDIVEVNDAFCDMLGYSQEEAGKLNIADFDSQWTTEGLLEKLRNFAGVSARFETIHRRKDGKLIDVEISATGVDIDGQLYIFASSRDITKPKAAKDKVRRLTQIYAALSQCNQAIVRCASEAELFPQICRDAVNFGGMKMAWIGMVDTTSNLVKPAASFGAGTEYLDNLEISVVNGIPTSQGPAGTSIRENKPVWCQDFQHDPATVAWHERGAKFGWRAIASLPLHRNEVVVGAFVLYSDTLNAFDERTQNLLLEMAMNISFALGNYARETERKQTEEENATLVERLDVATRAAKIGIWDWDIVNNNLVWDDRMFELYGARKEDFGGAYEIWCALIHPDDNVEVNESMQMALRSESTFDAEFRVCWPNGEIRNIKALGEIVRDAQGAPLRVIGVNYDVTDRNLAREKIQNLAFYDPLTHLPNRRTLKYRLQQMSASNARSGKQGAVLFIDLDNFKDINDTLGHHVGDLLLQQVALRLSSCVREDDTVVRLGGDEFVVVLNDLSEHALEATARTKAIGEKILAALRKPHQLETHTFHSTASIGAILFGHKQASDELMKQADIAMYQAKKAGRNTLRFFDPKMQSSITGRVALAGELRYALEQQQFQLYYQIQVDSSRRPLGAEALIRWFHHDRGMVSPAQFIPLAEENGLILPIGLWVLETACAQLKAWQQQPLTRDLVLAVNVSARQFHQADFVAQVIAVVKRHAINPMRLKLELTEGMLLENIEDTITTMNILSELGIQFSLDDFGTGFSSLQYLKRLPLDQLKIDQSFVRDIATDSSDKVIVRTIIAMAKSLDISVIAEGVETEEQRQLLLKNDCVHYQGYLFGRPMPIEQFEALLKRS